MRVEKQKLELELQHTTFQLQQQLYHDQQLFLTNYDATGFETDVGRLQRYVAGQKKTIAKLA